MDDSEEQMQAEDALWEADQIRHHDKFASLRAAARAEIDAGTTELLVTKNGDWIGKHDEYDRLSG